MIGLSSVIIPQEDPRTILSRLKDDKQILLATGTIAVQLVFSHKSEMAM